MTSIAMNVPSVWAGSAPDSILGRRSQITHDMIVDYLLTNPGHSYEEIGKAFGYGAVGIGVICRSDAFRARFEMRKAEISDPIVMEKIEKRLEGLASKSIDIIAKKLATSEDAKFALQVLSETNRAFGYGASKAQTVNNQFVVQLPGPAASSADWMAKFSKGEVPVLKSSEQSEPMTLEARDATD